MKKVVGLVALLVVIAGAATYMIVFKDTQTNSQSENTTSSDSPRAGMLERSATFTDPLTTPKELEKFRSELAQDNKNFTVLRDFSENTDWSTQKVIAITFFSAPGENITNYSIENNLVTVEVTTAAKNCTFVQTQNEHIVLVPVPQDADVSTQDSVALNYIQNQESCND